jgi:hypothetical protein
MKIRSIASYLAVSVCLAPVAVKAQLSDQSVRERADALLKQMTLEEKAGQLNQASGVRSRRFRMTRSPMDKSGRSCGRWM